MNFYEVKESNPLRQAVGWIVDIVLVLYMAGFVIYGFAMQVDIAGQSMFPVLNSEDVVLVNRIVYNFTDPKRYDVVVFRREDQKSNVKRIIGLPGEEIQIKAGLIYINGIVLEHEQFHLASLAGLAEEPVQLGENEYFLLGDNREGSEDSRFANIGNVRRNQIIGKVWLRTSPFIDLGLIH